MKKAPATLPSFVNWRRDLAMQYLRDKTLGVGQIAWLLDIQK
jgi:hypothetical protein